MLDLTPTASPTRIVSTIPGVPESLARALDRRRRLTRQLQSFRAIDRGPVVRIVPILTEPAGPGPA
jgi:hypothetical protein